MLEQNCWIESGVKEWWLVGMTYEGIREIEKRLTNIVTWSATFGQVNNWVYEVANLIFI